MIQQIKTTWLNMKWFHKTAQLALCLQAAAKTDALLKMGIKCKSVSKKCGDWPWGGMFPLWHHIFKTMIFFFSFRWDNAALSISGRDPNKKGRGSGAKKEGLRGSRGQKEKVQMPLNAVVPFGFQIKPNLLVCFFFQSVCHYQSASHPDYQSLHIFFQEEIFPVGKKSIQISASAVSVCQTSAHKFHPSWTW